VNPRLRGRLSDLRAAVFPPRGSPPQVLKGTVSRVVLVRDPVPGVFREAVFLLCERVPDRAGMSREELLRQARQAALDYCAARRPPRRRSVLPLLLSHLACLLSGALLARLLL